MGSRGPVPKSVEEKLAAGNPGKRRLPTKTVKPTADDGLLTPSAHLGAVAKAEWKRLAGELLRMGLLANVDRAAFEGYCDAYGMWRTAQSVVAKKGRTYKTATGFIRPRPEVKMAADAQKQLKVYMTEFGLTPAARARMASPAPVEEEKSLAELLFEKADA